MKKLSILLAVPVLLAACSISTNDKIVVTNFEECVAAGNPVMESFPRQCDHDGQRFIEVIAESDECGDIYDPVCGEIQVQCVTTPCDPIRTTFESRCHAKLAEADNISAGACPETTDNPEGACLAADGIWLAEFNECERMDEKRCEDLGGIYNECGSACRHDEEAQACTLQCIQFCKF